MEPQGCSLPAEGLGFTPAKHVNEMGKVAGHGLSPQKALAPVYNATPTPIPQKRKKEVSVVRATMNVLIHTGNPSTRRLIQVIASMGQPGLPKSRLNKTHT